jgi:hypothetical protein
MTSEHLTAVLAEKIMRWSIGPDRFMMGDRRWMPRWRFQPTENLIDAFQLLDSAAPDEYSMSGGNDVGFLVRVRIGKVIGEARGISKPLAITQAIARAVGIEVEP